MAILTIIEPLLILALAIFLIQQFIIPIYMSRPTFPLFRRKKERPKNTMTAKKALELVDHHCSEALRYIEMAESYSENEEKEAQLLLKKAREIEKSVKERSNKLKILKGDEK